MGVKIKDIPISDRPCERLIEHGAEALSNEELIAIIFKTGLRGTSAKDLATFLLSKVGNIKKMNDIVNDKFQISSLILDKKYYNKVGEVYEK